MGIEGVGQSSWGPTLFALFENESAADAFVAYAQQDPMGERLGYQVASTDNCGASISESLSIEGD
jgi:predicted sugar kinase